jgi:hypothetical protein
MIYTCVYISNTGKVRKRIVNLRRGQGLPSGGRLLENVCLNTPKMLIHANRDISCGTFLRLVFVVGGEF